MKQFNILYGDIAFSLLEKIAQGLLICHDIYSNNPDDLVASDHKLTDHYCSLRNGSPFKGYINKGINNHITEGLVEKHQKRYGIYPRISRLTIQAFIEAKEIEKNANFQGKVIPSPLYILKLLLTVPEEPQSEAFAVYFCRVLLFKIYGILPIDKNVDQNFDNYLDEEDIRNYSSSFRKYLNIQMRWPRWNDNFPAEVAYGDKKKLFYGHFLSMKGFYVLWFEKESYVNKYLNGFNEKDVEETFLSSKLYFRLLSKYYKQPDDDEIINLIFGIPLPISGADIVFQGGLKKAANSGLVISLNGCAGVGKTSVALSIAAVLSPLNTKCLYMTLEEGIHDLENRLLSLVPDYLKDMSIFNNHKTRGRKFDWFYPIEIQDNKDIDAFTENTLIFLRNNLITDAGHSEDTNKEGFVIPSVCPALIVIDNINEFLIAKDKQKGKAFYANLEKFIHECRKLKAMVIIISGDKMPQKTNMDYLVDMVIDLEHKGTGELDEKPYRALHLTKSRHQITRTGSHVYHLSGLRGFRIAPQVSSQIDKKEILKKPVVSDKEIINTLNLPKSKDGDKPFFERNIDIFPNSHILIHGSGSGGKAGFALKILLTPPVKKSVLQKINDSENFLKFQENNKIGFSNLKYRRKVLIISFLYPEKYYTELVYEKENNINSTIQTCYKGLLDPKIEVLGFFPGFLSPEDFINKVTRKLDSAILKGEPFNGILLDGMHNVFLQFKVLQERDIVWPLLYSILSRYNLTVVTTFTNFSFNKSLTEYSLSPDYMYLQKGQTPFLHVVVKATDHYFLLEETSVRYNDKTVGKEYLIKPVMTIKQEIKPDIFLMWDKQNAIIRKFDGSILISSENKELNIH